VLTDTANKNLRAQENDQSYVLHYLSTATFRTPSTCISATQTECIFTVNMKLLLVSYLCNHEETWFSNLRHLLTSPFRHEVRRSHDHNIKTQKWSLRKTAARPSVEILTILILQVHFSQTDYNTPRKRPNGGNNTSICKVSHLII